jgi:hypothetical protein
LIACIDYLLKVYDGAQNFSLPRACSRQWRWHRLEVILAPSFDKEIFFPATTVVLKDKIGMGLQI